VLGSDYRDLSSPITSLNGGTNASGTVTILNDDANEDTESFSLHLHNCTNTVAQCTLNSLIYASIIINDNDGMYYFVST